MSFLLSPVVNAVVQAASASVTTIVWYTAGGVWWAGKRLIYGKQHTAEEKQQEYQKRQLELDEKILAQLTQQTQMLNNIRAMSLPGLMPPHIHLAEGTFDIQDSCTTSLLIAAHPTATTDGTTTDGTKTL